MPRKPLVQKTTRGEREDRLSALAAVAGKIVGFRPAREELRRVRAVPTIFPQYDHAVRVGGHPIERVTTIHGPSNHGKAVAIETPVLTPSGWVPIGTLQIDDEVIGSDGKAHKVLGVFPQGKKQLFRVTFSDNASIECCDEHLWKTATKKEEDRGRYARGPRPERKRIATDVVGDGSVKSLAQIREEFVPGDHAIPLVAPIEFGVVNELQLDPYLLGLLLGDGSLAQTSVSFDKPESDLHEAIAARLPRGDSLTRRGSLSFLVGGGVLRAVRKLGLNVRSFEKFVPDEYLYASVADRIALLRGLLDTDGHVIKEGASVEFSTSSPKLAEAVVFLVRSLGGLVSLNLKSSPAYTYRGEKRVGRPSHRVFIFFDNGIVPIASQKHLAKWKGRARRNRRTIVSIDPTRFAEAVCIAVDSPDRLFVIDGFVLTHNTLYALGLGKSFLLRDHFFCYVDAERTTPITWIETLFGPGLADHPGFVARRPETFEKTTDEVRKFAEQIGNARDQKKLPPNTTALILVDSIRKLVPEGFLKKISKGAAGSKGSGVDGFGGRGAQIKAGLNSAWLDELVPLLEQTGTALSFIARETDDADADIWAKKAGEDFKVGGGKAVVYDSSLVVRVNRASYVRGPGGDDERKPVFGERHRLTVWKTKVAGKSDKKQIAYFHSSNGTFVPEGFDLARDLVELGKKFGVIKESGAWLSFDKRRWQGEHQAVKKISADEGLLRALEEVLRAQFDSVNPDEVDEDGIVKRGGIV